MATDCVHKLRKAFPSTSAKQARQVLLLLANPSTHPQVPNDYGRERREKISYVVHLSEQLNLTLIKTADHHAAFRSIVHTCRLPTSPKTYTLHGIELILL